MSMQSHSGASDLVKARPHYGPPPVAVERQYLTCGRMRIMSYCISDSAKQLMFFADIHTHVISISPQYLPGAPMRRGGLSV